MKPNVHISKLYKRVNTELNYFSRHQAFQKKKNLAYRNSANITGIHIHNTLNITKARKLSKDLQKKITLHNTNDILKFINGNNGIQNIRKKKQII